MAYRQIHTQIWKDAWFLDLEPDEKLLFIYLFSNDSTTLAGIYKISLKVIAFETGLEIERINQILDKFSTAEKAYYDSGVMWVVNLNRYNAAMQSPKVKACVKKEIDMIPDCRLKTRYLEGKIGYPYGIDTISLININNNNNNNIKEAAASGSGDFPAIPDDNTLQEIFLNVTGMVTFPGTSRASDLERMRAIYSGMQDKSFTADYLRRYFSEWRKRGYNAVNTNWLDWAISREIPKQKQSKKEEVYVPENHATEVY